MVGGRLSDPQHTNRTAPKAYVAFGSCSQERNQPTRHNKDNNNKNLTQEHKLRLATPAMHSSS